LKGIGTAKKEGYEGGGNGTRSRVYQMGGHGTIQAFCKARGLERQARVGNPYGKIGGTSQEFIPQLGLREGKTKKNQDS